MGRRVGSRRKARRRAEAEERKRVREAHEARMAALSREEEQRRARDERARQARAEEIRGQIETFAPRWASARELAAERKVRVTTPDPDALEQLLVREAQGGAFRMHHGVLHIDPVNPMVSIHVDDLIELLSK